jgi:hypothetical protein
MTNKIFGIDLNKRITNNKNSKVKKTRKTMKTIRKD